MPGRPAQRGFVLEELICEGLLDGEFERVTSVSRPSRVNWFCFHGPPPPDHAAAGSYDGGMAADVLVGRHRELHELDERLRTSRLVTIVGPGGVGKTALARTSALTVAPMFAMGVEYVDLTRVEEEAGIPGALAAQLGFDSFDALLSSPADRPVLLVVDNCEHLLDAAAHWLVQILGACQQPTILATSRSPLDIPGESVLPLAPLAVPELDREPEARRCNCSSSAAETRGPSSDRSTCRPWWSCAATSTVCRSPSRSPPPAPGR